MSTPQYENFYDKEGVQTVEDVSPIYDPQSTELPTYEGSHTTPIMQARIGITNLDWESPDFMTEAIQIYRGCGIDLPENEIISDVREWIQKVNESLPIETSDEFPNY